MRQHRPTIGPGTVAAVTGAASGIGRCVALLLGRLGVRLALADVDRAGLRAVVDALRRQERDVVGNVVDVTDPGAVDGWAQEVAGRWGTVHGVWNVAGVICAGDVLQTSLEDLRAVMDVDFWGVVHVTKAFLPVVVASGDGHVVTVSSAFGLVSAPSYGGYNAAKFAVRGWTDALRQEMRAGGRRVAVTAVYPGGVRTPIMTRASSAAGPEDAARLAGAFDRCVARTGAGRAAAVVVRGVRAGRPRVLVGPDARVADVAARLTGTGYERVLDAARLVPRRRS